MNKSLFYIGIPVSIALTFALLFAVPFAWTGFLSSIPLLGIKRYRSLLSGILIGFFVPFSLYFISPFGEVLKLGNVMSGITQLPSFFIILAFPIFYCIIMGVSAIFWNILFQSYYIGKEKLAI